MLRRRGTAHFQSGRPARVTVAGGRCPSSTSNMVKRCKNLHHILRIIHTCEKQVCTEPMGGYLFFTRPSCCKVATPLSRSQTFRKCVKNSPPTMYLKQLNIRDNTTLTRQWLSDHKCDLVLLNVMFGVFMCCQPTKKYESCAIIHQLFHIETWNNHLPPTSDVLSPSFGFGFTMVKPRP